MRDAYQQSVRAGVRLPCDVMFGAPQTRKHRRQTRQPNLSKRLHDIHHFARQLLKVVSDPMKARCIQLAKYAAFQKCDRVWLYCTALL